MGEEGGLVINLGGSEEEEVEGWQEEEGQEEGEWRRAGTPLERAGLVRSSKIFRSITLIVPIVTVVGPLRMLDLVIIYSWSMTAP